MRISNSFSEGEIQVMDFIVQTLLRGGSPTMATRHKEFASLCRKVMAMKGKVLEKQQKQQAEDAPHEGATQSVEQSATMEATQPSEAAAARTSSVGTIDAPALETPKENRSNDLATAV